MGFTLHKKNFSRAVSGCFVVNGFIFTYHENKIYVYDYDFFLLAEKEMEDRVEAITACILQAKNVYDKVGEDLKKEYQNDNSVKDMKSHTFFEKCLTDEKEIVMNSSNTTISSFNEKEEFFKTVERSDTNYNKFTKNFTDNLKNHYSENSSIQNDKKTCVLSVFLVGCKIVMLEFSNFVFKMIGLKYFKSLCPEKGFDPIPSDFNLTEFSVNKENKIKIIDERIFVLIGTNTFMFFDTIYGSKTKILRFSQDLNLKNIITFDVCCENLLGTRKEKDKNYEHEFFKDFHVLHETFKNSIHFDSRDSKQKIVDYEKRSFSGINGLYEKKGFWNNEKIANFSDDKQIPNLNSKSQFDQHKVEDLTENCLFVTNTGKNTQSYLDSGQEDVSAALQGNNLNIITSSDINTSSNMNTSYKSKFLETNDFNLCVSKDSYTNVCNIEENFKEKNLINEKMDQTIVLKDSKNNNDIKILGKGPDMDEIPCLSDNDPPKNVFLNGLNSEKSVVNDLSNFLNKNESEDRLNVCDTFLRNQTDFLAKSINLSDDRKNSTDILESDPIYMLYFLSRVDNINTLSIFHITKQKTPSFVESIECDNHVYDICVLKECIVFLKRECITGDVVFERKKHLDKRFVSQPDIKSISNTTVCSNSYDLEQKNTESTLKGNSLIESTDTLKLEFNDYKIGTNSENILKNTEKRHKEIHINDFDPIGINENSLFKPHIKNSNNSTHGSILFNGFLEEDENSFISNNKESCAPQNLSYLYQKTQYASKYKYSLHVSHKNTLHLKKEIQTQYIDDINSFKPIENSIFLFCTNGVFKIEFFFKKNFFEEYKIDRLDYNQCTYGHVFDSIICYGSLNTDFVACNLSKSQKNNFLALENSFPENTISKSKTAYRRKVPVKFDKMVDNEISFRKNNTKATGSLDLYESDLHPEDKSYRSPNLEKSSDINTAGNSVSSHRFYDSVSENLHRFFLEKRVIKNYSISKLIKIKNNLIGLNGSKIYKFHNVLDLKIMQKIKIKNFYDFFLLKDVLCLTNHKRTIFGSIKDNKFKDVTIISDFNHKSFLESKFSKDMELLNQGESTEIIDIKESKINNKINLSILKYEQTLFFGFLYNQNIHFTPRTLIYNNSSFQLKHEIVEVKPASFDCTVLFSTILCFLNTGLSKALLRLFLDINEDKSTLIHDQLMLFCNDCNNNIAAFHEVFDTQKNEGSTYENDKTTAEINKTNDENLLTIFYVLTTQKSLGIIFSKVQFLEKLFIFLKFELSKTNSECFLRKKEKFVDVTDDDLFLKSTNAGFSFLSENINDVVSHSTENNNSLSITKPNKDTKILRESPNLDKNDLLTENNRICNLKGDNNDLVRAKHTDTISFLNHNQNNEKLKSKHKKFQNFQEFIRKTRKFLESNIQNILREMDDIDFNKDNILHENDILKYINIDKDVTCFTESKKKLFICKQNNIFIYENLLFMKSTQFELKHVLEIRNDMLYESNFFSAFILIHRLYRFVQEFIDNHLIIFFLQNRVCLNEFYISEKYLVRKNIFFSNLLFNKTETKCSCDPSIENYENMNLCGFLCCKLQDFYTTSIKENVDDLLIKIINDLNKTGYIFTTEKMKSLFLTEIGSHKSKDDILGTGNDVLHSDQKTKSIFGNSESKKINFNTNIDEIEVLENMNLSLILRTKSILSIFTEYKTYFIQSRSDLIKLRTESKNFYRSSLNNFMVIFIPCDKVLFTKSNITFIHRLNFSFTSLKNDFFINNEFIARFRNIHSYDCFNSYPTHQTDLNSSYENFIYNSNDNVFCGIKYEVNFCKMFHKDEFKKEKNENNLDFTEIHKQNLNSQYKNTQIDQNFNLVGENNKKQNSNLQEDKLGVSDNEQTLNNTVNKDENVFESRVNEVFGSEDRIQPSKNYIIDLFDKNFNLLDTIIMNRNWHLLEAKFCYLNDMQTTEMINKNLYSMFLILVFNFIISEEDLVRSRMSIYEIKNVQTKSHIVKSTNDKNIFTEKKDNKNISSVLDTKIGDFDITNHESVIGNINDLKNSGDQESKHVNHLHLAKTTQKAFKHCTTLPIKSNAVSFTTIRGNIALAQGTRILIYKFDRLEGLTPIAFHDPYILVTKIEAVKNILLVGDLLNGIHLIYFQSKPVKLTKLASSEEICAMNTCKILEFEKNYNHRKNIDKVYELFFLCSSDSSIKIFSFAPKNIFSKNGKNMVKRVQGKIFDNLINNTEDFLYSKFSIYKINKIHEIQRKFTPKQKKGTSKQVFVKENLQKKILSFVKERMPRLYDLIYVMDHSNSISLNIQPLFKPSEFKILWYLDIVTKNTICEKFNISLNELYNLI